MANRLQQPMIVMTPPTQAESSTSHHPRRPPAYRSVSLLHSPRKKTSPPVKDASDSSSDSAVPASKATAGKSDSPSSLLPLGRDSSGESSNAEKWFEKSNNEVRDTSTTFADNEPPFFMRNSSSSETPPDAQQQMRQFLGINGGSHALPLRTGLLHLGTDGSSTEDFRGVIDDLTIENKKLKRRLKKYEKLHDSHLRDEKLFEVRIHGLPAEKKRELEETLRKFASSLGGPNGFPPAGYEGLMPLLNTHKTASSSTSIHNTDSAYASMSMSGQGSNTQSGGESRHKQMPTSSARRQNMHSNIHSYLHHIPEGLLPQQNPANMTERAKKKLVVRRLEQVFAGKGAAVGGHHHPMQQQEVSQSAARADRAASEAQGERARLEGNREAYIMRALKDEAEINQDGDNQYDLASAQRRKENSGTLKRNPAKQEEEYNEQRPTRPLDLDPHRAQVPAENIRYMRHLGFSPPEPGNTPEDGHGWVYLNLLINMAQLHTINVTADFVKKALTECSSKFELSEDGRKIRWKGGASITRSSSSGGASSTGMDSRTPDEQSPRKRPKLTHRESGKSALSLAHPGATSLRAQSEQNKLTYTPLFFHKDSTDEFSSSEEEDDSDESPYPAAPAGDSSGMTSSGVRTTSTKKPRKREDGPIIFYNNARFCTDLSGDRKTTGNANAPPYIPASALPVGKPHTVKKATVPAEKRGPLAQASDLPEPMDLHDNPIPESMEISFPQRSPLQDDPKHSIWKPVDMDVTGIGGVWPADHFAIAVESRQALLDQRTATAPSHDMYRRSVPDKFAQIFQEAGPGRKARAAVHQQIVNTKQQILPPAELPPALSFMPFSDGSQGDDESDGDDDMSISPESIGGFPPSAAPQRVEIPYAESEEEEEEEYSEDDSDDGSIDLLAGAREVDPDAIRRQEREYDANMADRLAEEIPAGSSAATAGGGSGFASPAAGVNREEYRRAIREARAKRPAELQRAKTTDSMKVQDPRESSSEDDEDEDEDEDEDMDDAAS